VYSDQEAAAMAVSLPPGVAEAMAKGNLTVTARVIRANGDVEEIGELHDG
jgi:hypothetical protein